MDNTKGEEGSGERPSMFPDPEHSEAASAIDIGNPPIEADIEMTEAPANTSSSHLRPAMQQRILVLRQPVTEQSLVPAPNPFLDPSPDDPERPRKRAKIDMGEDDSAPPSPIPPPVPPPRSPTPSQKDPISLIRDSVASTSLSTNTETPEPEDDIEIPGPPSFAPPNPPNVTEEPEKDPPLLTLRHHDALALEATVDTPGRPIRPQESQRVSKVRRQHKNILFGIAEGESEGSSSSSSSTVSSGTIDLLAWLLCGAESVPTGESVQRSVETGADTLPANGISHAVTQIPESFTSQEILDSAVPGPSRPSTRRPPVLSPLSERSGEKSTSVSSEESRKDKTLNPDSAKSPGTPMIFVSEEGGQDVSPEEMKVEENAARKLRRQPTSYCEGEAEKEESRPSTSQLSISRLPTRKLHKEGESSVESVESTETTTGESSSPDKIQYAEMSSEDKSSDQEDSDQT